MKTTPFTALLAVFVSSAAAAQARAECHRPARSSRDIESCAELRLRAAEDSLRVVESRVRTIMDSGTVHAFNNAARIWRQYRIAECEAVYASYQGGSAADVGLLNCETSLTEQRSVLLRNLYLP